MAEDVKHTAGPWERVPQTQGGDLIAHPFETGNQMNPKGLRLVAFMMVRGNSLAEDEANARLIAAAPDLLSALRNALIDLEYALVYANGGSVRYADLETSIEVSRAAIARAIKGEA